MSERNITADRRTLGFLLRQPYERLQREVYGGLAARGFPDIRPAHSAVFRHIAARGSRLTALAEQAGMTKQSMAYLVEGLAEGGYVATAPDPQDGRARLVKLTARGRRVWDALIALSAEAEARIAARVGPARLAELRAILEELAEG
ncbi:MarR family winged helix-turn-helix transcriptional regulator [Siccirubricoccus phaeus]|uniref:MarR family winged helix-turn-helix transcriptional regulator n=1 Tax=Siccirubricoccus phaeus TaxID=2595053 RepID=UPI0011F3779B|nr:MarR family winged helix-turn-helix transcriptional regulator [Siccirubricoccus phaeus]